MKKALIFDGAIVQIEAAEFPVAPPLIWVDAPADATIGTHIYDGAAVVPKPAPPPPTPEQVIDKYTALIQKRLDDFAKTRGYDGILSACTYATSAVTKFKAEGQYAVQARDNTWATGAAIMADVAGGNRPVPTWEELEAELPQLEWPV